MNKLIFFFFILFFGLSSCKKWDLEEVNFLQLEITSIEPNPINESKLTLKATIYDFTNDFISDHGFVYIQGKKTPNIYDKKESLGNLQLPLTGVDSFDTRLDNFSPNTTYTFRAYAETAMGRFFYSDTMHYTTGAGMVTTDTFHYISQTTNLELYGRFANNGAIDVTAVQYGFCWSEDEDNQLPTLANMHSSLSPSGNAFSYIYEDLKQAVPLYFRAYAIILYGSDLAKDTLYGETITFQMNLDTWLPKASSPFDGREGAISFSIGDKGYTGTGILLASFEFFDDFWEYDPEMDHWTQKAAFPTKRADAIGFSIESDNISKGYVGTGYDDLMCYNDFWSYEPDSNSWNSLLPVPGEDRAGAIGFSIGDKGYVGTGWNPDMLYFADFYKYNPEGLGSWDTLPDFDGGAREYAIGFSIGNKGYVGTGRNESKSIIYNDFWEFNPNNTLAPWNELELDTIPGRRYNAIGFSIEDKGYVGTGQDEFYHYNDFYEYDPDIGWMTQDSFPGGIRYGAVGFSIGTKGYVGLGYSGSYKTDFWSFEK